MSIEKDEIYEYRGVEDLVVAKVVTDTSDLYEAGEVVSLAGVAEISKSTSNSSDVHYYDNNPAIVIDSEGEDEIKCTTSAIPLDKLALITGKTYDETTGALIDDEREQVYFAMGYKTQKTNGEYVYVWRYKGTFSIPDSDHKTKDSGTDANGQELTYKGISTIHKFNNTFTFYYI